MFRIEPVRTCFNSAGIISDSTFGTEHLAADWIEPFGTKDTRYDTLNSAGITRISMDGEANSSSYVSI
jgi:hypothetical protein